MFLFGLAERELFFNSGKHVFAACGRDVQRSTAAARRRARTLDPTCLHNPPVHRASPEAHASSMPNPIENDFMGQGEIQRATFCSTFNQSLCRKYAAKTCVSGRIVESVITYIILLEFCLQSNH